MYSVAHGFLMCAKNIEGREKSPCGHVLGITSWLSCVFKKYRSIIFGETKVPAGTYSVAHGFLAWDYKTYLGLQVLPETTRLAPDK